MNYQKRATKQETLNRDDFYDLTGKDFQDALKFFEEDVVKVKSTSRRYGIKEKDGQEHKEDTQGDIGRRRYSIRDRRKSGET